MENNNIYGNQPYAQYGGTAGVPTYQPLMPKVLNAFKPDISDFIFAVAAFALGYLFSRWVYFAWQGWGVAAFTTAYLLVVTAYMMIKGTYLKSRAAFFWLSITWLTGVSFALWSNMGFNGIRSIFLFCSAVYYILISSGNAIMGKTGNYLLIDGFMAVIIIPFRNFFNQYVSFSVLGKEGKNRKALSALIGAAVALILAAILIPMLESADSGGFGMIMASLRNIFNINPYEVMWYALFAIPVAAYLYGLVSGVAHKKGTDIIKPESATKTAAAMRILQPTTVFVVLGSVLFIYLVFIFSQIPYFFSALAGARPKDWLVYSEYARRGFFELCGIVLINLLVLTICNITSKKPRKESKMLKAFNISLAVITLVLIATAFSKMALYIDAYGLTMLRLLPCVFMVFLAIAFFALIALQRFDFSIVRFLLITGAVFLCVLSLGNPDALVVRYNADRYMSGSLPGYDMEIVRRAGDAGILPTIEVYDKTSETYLKTEIEWYLNSCSSWQLDSNANRVSLESHLAREALASVDFTHPRLD